jgi:hypothetical protein
MIATAPIDELLGTEGLDPDADAAIAAVMARAGLGAADYAEVATDDEGDGPTMTAAARMQISAVPQVKLTSEEVTTLVQANVEALNLQSRSTTDGRMLRDIQEQVNSLSFLGKIAPYMPASVPKPVRFGHSEKECFAFETPTVRGIHNGGLHVFWNHIYETSDPVEIGALRRMVAEGFEDEDQLVVLDDKAEAYKDRYGRLLGWEKPGSANVKRWVKLNMLRQGG